MRHSKSLLALGFVVAALLGYWLAQPRAPLPVTRLAEPSPPAKWAVQPPGPERRYRSADRPPAIPRDDEALDAGALAGQRILVFKSQAALEAFLKRAGDKLSLLGRINALNALRVGFLDPADLAALVGNDAESSFIFPAYLPAPPDGTAQAGAVPLGAELLAWLGITEDNSQWGKGVRIAILDTGVTQSQAFSSSITATNIVDLLADPTQQNGHGTAVASVIIGRTALTPGVAPGADILSFRIADDRGQSDSFLIAQGIIAAVDAGAQLINISLGSPGDSILIRNAIDYASKRGALIVAASGNNGLNRISYPAASAGVVAVGAVDALGEHLDFSNSGTQLAISAPGFGINTAWVNGRSVSVNGTSFSSPIATGSIAALMSQRNLSAQQAYQLLISNLNDGGAPGNDPFLGGGTPDLGRALNSKKPGIYDAALASQNYLPPSANQPNGQLEVLVQNRGTEPLTNLTVRIQTPNGLVSSNITRIPVNGVQTVRLPIASPSNKGVGYTSAVQLSGGRVDSKPSNDSRNVTHVPKVSK